MTSPARRAQRRDANERELIDGLRQCGFKVWQSLQVDLLIFRPDIGLRIVEVKDPAKPPSARPITKLERQQLEAVGPLHGTVAHTLDEVLQWLRSRAR